MPDRRIRLAFLADVQIGCMATFSGADDDAITRFGRRGMSVRKFPRTDALDWDAARFRDTVAEVNRLQPDLAVIGGDMIDEISRPDQLEVFREIAATCEVPFHYVPGNHDICHDAAVPTEASLDWYRANFGPEHGTATRDLTDAWRLTLLTVNSAVLDQPRNLDGAYEAEMAWLEDELRHRAPGPTIVFSHHPPFVGAPDEGHNYWNIPIERRRPFLDLLAGYEVDLVLCGHRHLNDRVEYRDVEIVTSAAVGFPLGLDPPGFRLVDIDETGISHTYHPVPDPAWEAIGGPPDPDAC
jgi:3',5'-cyclic AMP phosphodiesterase CpdA